MLRLFGGLAVLFHCESAKHKALERNYVDIDFMGRRNQGRAIKKLFIDLGYVPRDIFNSLQGDRRLIFNDIKHERRVDIFLELFEMCHSFNLKNRLTLDKPTIPLADLLATKLQVVEITEREYRDILALVRDHEIGDSDAPEIINGNYLAALASDDWGVYKTFSSNISNILSALPQYELGSASQETIRTRLLKLQTKMENTPKSMRWKLRSRVGTKVRWYELPEKDKEVVDSRLVTTTES